MKVVIYILLMIATETGTQTLEHAEQVSPPVNIAGSV